MARRNRIAKTVAIEAGRSFTQTPSHRRARRRDEAIPPLVRALVVVFLLCLGIGYGWAQKDDPRQAQPKDQKQAQPVEGKQPQQKNTQPAKPGGPKQAQKDDHQQMRGLDEQIQEIKSDVLSLSAELSQLEEKLLYPSGTQVAIFVALAQGDPMRLDAVQLQIDGQLVAHYIYSFKELEALRKGGEQRIYVGNVATGDHQLEVLVNGKLEGGADFSQTEHFTFRKEVKPKLVGLTLASPGSGNTPISLGEW